jgi:hypothetical protein
MPRNRPLLIGLSILLVAVLTIFLAPLSVSSGLRLWAWWHARQQGLQIELGKIDARFLRPAVIHNLRISDANGASFHSEIRADRVIVDLNMARILAGAPGRAIRSLSIEGLRAQMNRNDSGGARKQQLSWPMLQKLLPNSFNVASSDLRIEDGATVILLRNASLSGSQIEYVRLNVY